MSKSELVDALERSFVERPTPSSLDNLRRRDLVELARKEGVTGLRSLRKEELVEILKDRLGLAGESEAPKAGETVARAEKSSPTPSRPTEPASRSTEAPAAARRRAAPAQARRNAAKKVAKQKALEKDISTPPIPDAPRDRIVVTAPDPHWLHAAWDVSDRAILRAKAALAADWYNAKPILRLMDVTTSETTRATESLVRDVEIQGGVNSWYLRVTGVDRCFRVDIGYVSERGRFFTLARSNVVRQPDAAQCDPLREDWRNVRRECERMGIKGALDENLDEESDVRDLFDDRLRRPLKTSTVDDWRLRRRFGKKITEPFFFDVDAELIVYGATLPNADVQVSNESVQLRPDGSFTIRFSLQEGRQVLPAVAQAEDGSEERTVILSIERNTKCLEPLTHDGQD